MWNLGSVVGKLGGRELNYSSDIDLMFLYGANGQTSGSDVITNREFYKKVANRYTAVWTYTAGGVCYRVDLRLRPEGNFTARFVFRWTARKIIIRGERAIGNCKC